MLPPQSERAGAKSKTSLEPIEQTLPVTEALKKGLAGYGQPAEHSEGWLLPQSLEMFLPIPREGTTWQKTWAPVARLGPSC
jgi:hypothetical protein